MAQVPQADGQLAQFVVPQVSVSQQDAKQREGQSALTPSTLLQRRRANVKEKEEETK